MAADNLVFITDAVTVGIVEALAIAVHVVHPIQVDWVITVSSISCSRVIVAGSLQL